MSEDPREYASDSFARGGNFLLVTSALYLSLPWLIFAIGWLRDYVAFVTVASLLLLNVVVVRRFLTLHSLAVVLGWIREHIWQLIFALVLAVLTLFAAGVGGVGYQTADWFKHNAILKELATQPWPAYVQIDGENLPLVYYFAFYLPAATVGKVFGSWALLNVMQAVWSLIGFGLAFGWFWVLVRRVSVVSAVIFVAFSGLDVVGVLASLIWQPAGYLASLLENSHIEWWAAEFQYSSNATLLFWAPQHAIGGWVVAGSLMHLYSQKDLRKLFPFFFALSMFWSPLVALGLLIFAAADLWRRRLRQQPALIDIATYAPSAWLLILMLAFYATQLSANLGSGSFALSLLDPMIASNQGIQILLVFLLFLLVEVGAYAWIIWLGRKLFSDDEIRLFLTTMACLILLPLFRVGLFNDLVMRTSIPALFVLAVFFTRILLSASSQKSLRVIAVLVLLVGAITPLFEFKRQVERWASGQGVVIERQDLQSIEGIEALLETEDSRARRFYIGSSETWFFENLAQIR